MKILLLEDNEAIAKGLKYSLEQKGFEVVHLPRASGVEDLSVGQFDIAVLDVNLPDGNGFDVYRNYVKPAEVPAIFLTARDTEDDIVRGLEIGAEDYVTKPFSTRELMARINKILGKSRKTVTFGDCVFDMDKPEVTKDGKVVEMTGLEMKILKYFCANSGRAVSRDAIIEKIWEWTGNDVNDNTVTVYIKRLRSKLGEDSIVTVKGMGYRIDGK